MADRLTRATLVLRAADLADEIGLDALTITRVGRAVGIAPPGVYRHVADVADLRRAIGTLAATEVTRVVEQAGAGLGDQEALLSVATALRTWAGAHPARYAALQEAPDPDDAAGATAAAGVVAALAATLRGYRLTGDDLTDGIRLLRATVHGFVDLELRGGFKQPRDLTASFERAVRALDPALRSWGR